jgi:poly(A)-specific ribonuclease
VLDTYLMLMSKTAFTCSESIATSFPFYLQLVGFAPNGIISELLFCFSVLLFCRSSHFISGAKHEAGYDAYMTGCVFSQLCRYLGIKFEDLSPQENLARNNKLQKHINFLSPSWNSGTVVDLSTGMDRPDPGYMRRYPAAVYDNIVLIWGFQSKVRPKEIRDSISKVFGPALVSSVFSIDSTAVLMQFSKQESVNDFLDLKAVLERTDSAISILHPLSTILEGGCTRAAKYDTYRDICSSY